MGLPKPSLITELKRVDSALTQSQQALAEAHGRIVSLTREVEELQNKLKAAQTDARKDKRSANKFSKGQSKPNPKKPGRKPGEGDFQRRKPAEAKPGDEVRDMEAPLDQTTCSECGAPLDISTETPTTVDIPETPKRIILRWTRQIGLCPNCGKRHLGHHPDLPESQTGATLHRVGENAQATCHWLHYRMGLSQRRSVEVLAQLTGVEITQSAAVQDAARHCQEKGQITKCCDNLLQDLRKAPSLHTDDTGWAIGVILAFVMGFFTRYTKLFFINLRHRSDEVLAILTEAFIGVLITDRGSSYDADKLDWIRFQKCLAHLLRNIKEALEGKTGAAKKFLEELRDLLKESIQHWNDYHEGKMTREELQTKAKEMDEKLKTHLRHRRLRDPDAARILAGIGMRHDNEQLTLFLHEPEVVSPTNNMAERDLRSIIILRKNSQCSKNARGADTLAKMVSIFATMEARGLDVISTYKEILRTGQMPEPKAA